jgi:hypothetical protein
MEPPRRDPPTEPPELSLSGGPARRWLWFGAGWGFMGLGLLGAALPMLPATPFLLLALWAFSRSSVRFHAWLWHHPHLGPPLQRWKRHRVVPRRVKAVAATSMLVSLASVALFTRPPWWVLAAFGLVVAGSLAFLWSVPSRPPDSA